MGISKEEFEAVKQRVEALEQRLAKAPEPAQAQDFEWPVGGDEGEPPEEGKVFFADLRNRLGDAQQGLISIIGGVYRFAPDKNLYWQSRYANHPLKSPLIEYSNEVATQLASIFSSAQRLRLLEAMVGAVKSSAELRKRTGLGSGALYHHLRGLMHGGFVEQRGRGRYTLTASGMGAIVTFLHLAHQRGPKAPREREEAEAGPVGAEQDRAYSQSAIPGPARGSS